MAKKKKKAKNHLPKRIAGVKVPKSVRRSRFGALLASPAGQALVAEAVLGAGALVATKTAHNPKVREGAKGATDRIGHAGDEAKHEFAAASSTLTYAVGEAARSFADALRHGAPEDEEHPHKDGPRWSSDDEKPAETTPKKQAKAREAAP